jgi:hypothetical protein
MRRRDSETTTDGDDRGRLDALLEELHHLRALEERRRQFPVSSPAFDRAADEAVLVSRRIFELARTDGEGAPSENDDPIDDSIDDPQAS